MFNKLEKILKDIKGNVLTIGIDDNLLNIALKNEKINLYAIYSNSKLSFNQSKNSSKRKTNKGKKISIKKLRKYISKKSSDFLIINMDEIYKYTKFIIRDTIYINRNTIYLYFSKDSKNIDNEMLLKRYNRYDVSIEMTEYKNYYLLKIDASNAQNNWIKDKIYFIKDTFYNIAEFIGNLLIS